MSITEIAIRRPTLVVVIFTVLTILGVLSYRQLNYNLFPRFEVPVISVITTYPGASSAEVETSVTEVVEDVLSSLASVDKVTAISQEGVSIVTLQLTNDADADLIIQDAQRYINASLTRLPDDADPPSLNKFSLDDLPILTLSASANLPPTEFYQLLDERITPQLARVPGIGQIRLVGGSEREIQVNVQNERLRAYNLSIGQVVNAVAAANQDFPTGNVEEQRNQYALRVSGRFTSVEQLADLEMRLPAGGTVKLSQLAQIVNGTREVTTLNRINGQSAVGVLIQKQRDANTVSVAEQVKVALNQIQAQNKGINLRFLIASDSSVFTLAAADAVIDDLIYAVILVALVMLIFLHSLRNSLIVMIAVPASIVSTFIAMYLFGFSLNLMTLMALSLVVGILVDDSIVVLENIYRHLEMGKDSRTAALDGRNEIGFTALSITLVDIVIFVPLSLVTGLIGGIIREFSIVVAVSTLMSLFVSFTITPMLASRFSKITPLTRGTLMGRFGLWFEAQFDALKNGYRNALQWSLHHRRWVFMPAVLLFFGSIALLPLGFIGSAFIPAGDRGEFIVSVELDPSATVYQNNLTTAQIEKMILNQPEVVKVFTSVGTSTTQGTAQATNNVSELTVVMTDKKEREISVDAFANQIKNKIQAIPGVRVRSTPTGLTGGATNLPIQIAVRGDSMPAIQQAANQVLSIVQRIPGVSDPTLSVNLGRPELQIQFDRDRMAALGISVADVGSTLMTAFTGNTQSKYREAGTEYDIRVQFERFDRSNIEEVSHLTFLNAQGRMIELNQFATVRQNTGATRLERKDRLPSITVQSNVVGRPVGTVGQEIQQAVNRERLPEGITLAYQGQLEQQAEAFSSLGTAFLIGILFVYLVMVALYESYVYPLVVLFSIPLAIIGALLALALTMQPLSIFSILGIIMMVGLVTKNAILLVDFTNHLKAKGADTEAALLEAGQERLRPILMTTLTMIIGMLPIALSTAPASEAKVGLAWAMIGGLTSSMFLTLLVVPIVYLSIDRLIDRVERWRNAHKPDVTYDPAQST